MQQGLLYKVLTCSDYDFRQTGWANNSGTHRNMARVRQNVTHGARGYSRPSHHPAKVPPDLESCFRVLNEDTV